MVLEMLRSKTKIKARSDEEMKEDGRGRPVIDIVNTKQKTDARKG